MKRNMVPLLGIAFVAAIVATGVVYGLFGGRLRGKSVEPIGQSIVVAARDLERGTVITAADLQLSQVKGTLKGSYSKVDEVLGGTLLDAVQKNEPLLEGRVASLDPKAGGASGGVAAGMRAVSIRVTESTGLMGLLHAGSRVDLQAVSERNGPAELRTILQNVEVLRVNPQLEPAANSRVPVPVATMLVPAQYADLIALADAGAHIRMTLRNPLDDATAPRRSLGLASVFSGSSGAESESVRKTPAASNSNGTGANRGAAGAPNHDTQLHAIRLNVQVLGASAAAISQLDSKLAGPADGDSMRVASFRTDTDADELIQKLEKSRELELVSTSVLTASVGQPVSVRASAAQYRLRVQFAPAADSAGKISLRVAPEISLRQGPGLETRRYDADLPDGGSFLVRGLLGHPNSENGAQNEAGILARLFPGHAWSGRELIIFVTARPAGQIPSPAVAQTTRGQ